MRRSALALILLSFVAAPCLAATPDALDRDVPALLTQHHVPSVAIAEIQDGQIVMTRVYGEQSPGVPATPDTLYNVASLTKPITAEVVLRLVAAGKLGLDDKVSADYVDPDVADDPRTQLLTPRLMLSHQSGFPNWRSATKGKLTYLFTPGTGVSYSGEGYQYTLRFVEAKLHASFTDLAQTYVFGPAGMKVTSYTQQPWFSGRVAHPADATGQWLEPEMTQTPVGADLVYTTAGDYGRLITSIMADQGMTPALSAERLRVQVSRKATECPHFTAGGCPDDIGFGLGWEVIKAGGHTYFMHTGRDTGLSTLSYFNPETKTGVIILTSGESGMDLVLPILADIGLDPDFQKILRAEAGQ